MTKKQRIDQWERKVAEIVRHWRRLSEACDAAHKAGCLDIDGELYGAMWQAFEGLLEMVDCNGWIDWHVFENDCGKAARKAGMVGKMRTIRTHWQLAALIVELEMEGKK